MQPLKSFLILAVAGASLLGLGGCVYEDEPPRRLTHDPKPYAPDPAPTAEDEAAPPTSSAPTPMPTSLPPMLVEVDTDQTMEAIGGEGVGVFIEYGKGGHWHVWWTCDTSQTRQKCDFAVSVVAASGALSNVDGSKLPEGSVKSTTAASRVDVTSTTTTEVHGLRFDTDPGTVITVDAAVGGLKDGAFLFFVQDGKVNGGFTGKLTNPLQLQGKTP